MKAEQLQGLEMECQQNYPIVNDVGKLGHLGIFVVCNVKFHCHCSHPSGVQRSPNTHQGRWWGYN